MSAMLRRISLCLAAVVAATSWQCASASCSSRSGTALPDSQDQAIRVTALLTSTLSLLGSSFIVFSYFFFPQLRTLAYRLIVALSVADILASLSYMMGSISSMTTCAEWVCYLTAGMSQWFELSTFAWTACISFNIYQVLVKNVGKSVEGYEKYYHMVAWGVPLLFLVIVASAGALGDAGLWCWIKESHAWARFLFFYLPLIAVLTYNTVVFTVTVRAVRNTMQESSISFRLRLYLAVFVASRFFSVVNRVQNFAAPNHPVFILYMLQAIFEPLQGLGNALVYGLNKMVLSQYRMQFKDSRWCRLCFPRWRAGSMPAVLPPTV